jgi:thioesterase domain-containing protein/3-oxoacyl-(acyl-carrier-protein) synthase/acyl carrier protein
MMDEGQVRDHLKAIVAGVIGHDVQSSEPLMAAGLDSLGATEMVNILTERFGLEFASTFVMDYPSIDAMVESIMDSIDSPTGDVEPALEDVVVMNNLDSTFAQGLFAFDEFRDVAGSESIGFAPVERWDYMKMDLSSENFSDVPIRFASYLRDIGHFDPSAFRMFKAEATLMDPQQRLLLEAAFSLKHQTNFSRENVGCYIACCSLDYTKMPMIQSMPINGFSFASSSLSVVSGRTSFSFGLRGPSLTIDVACASSLVTTHLGLRYLKESISNSAICGGSMVSFIPASTLSLQNAGFLADDGRCKSFDQGANGYGRGEACRLAYIKNFDDEDFSTGIVLCGSAVNHSGFSSSLTAPNGPAQEEVMQKSILTSTTGIQAIHQLQTHCIGTALGDPIELKACFTIMKRLGAASDHTPLVSISSRKGATGHQEGAAGIMLLHNCVLSLQLNCLPGINHLRSLNPYIVDQIASFSSACLSLPRGKQLLAYQENESTTASVNSFAAQGTNSNIVLKCYRDAPIQENAALNWKKEYLWACSTISPKIEKLLFSVSDVSSRYSKLTFAIPLNTLVFGRIIDMGVSYRWLLPASVIVDAIDTAATVCTSELAQISNLVVSRYFMVSKAVDLFSSVMNVTIESDGEVSVDFQLQGQDRAYPSEASQQYSVTALMSSLKDEFVPDVSIAGEYKGRLSGGFPLLSAYYESENNEEMWFMDSLNPLSVLPEGKNYDDSLQPGIPQVLSTIKSFAIQRTGQKVQKQVVAYENVEGGVDLIVKNRISQRQVILFDGVGYNQAPIAHARKLSLYSNVSDMTMQVYKEVDFVRVSSDPSTDDDDLSPLYKEKYPDEFKHYKEPKGENLEKYVNTGYEEIRELVMKEVKDLIGYTPQDDEPLMSSGMDSRNAMELRSSLNNAIGMKLPATLLYDYQTVEAIAKFTAVAIEKTEAEQGSDVDSDATTPQIAKVPELKTKSQTPSVKTLRGNMIRPLFLAAPGVANGQSAYFAFMQFLSWCDQPIYTLEKDNDLTIHELAKNHVEDRLKVQPYGPYLIGGHSYGGVVAIEVAIQMRKMGREIGGVFLFDAPHPCQIRKSEADAIANDKNAVELMEMILNAIDFGHQRQGWQNMPFYQKYEYFAPVYRIMRDENFSAVQVREQVLAIASAIKTGNQPSDMRSHVFSGYLEDTDVYYFRASIRGVVAYMHDEDHLSEEFPHGVGWMDFVDDLKIIDVPGDHFTMLRQPLADMRLISESMKQVLVLFGWQELKKEKEVFSLNKEEAAEMEEYLKKMGLRKEDTEHMKANGGLWFVEHGNNNDPSKNDVPIVQHMKNYEYDYDIEDVQDNDIGTGLVAQFHMALNSDKPQIPLTSDHVKIVRLNDLDYQLGDLCCFFFHDVTGYVDLLDDLTSCFSLQCFGLQLPDFECLHSVRNIEELVEAYVEAIQIIQPEAPYILIGFGMGCQLAYEAAVQMGPEKVASVMFIDGQVTKERGYHQDAIWYGLYTLIAQEISVDKFVKEMQRRRRFEDQLQYMLQFCPEDTDPSDWDQSVNEQLCKTHFCAMAGEAYEPDKFYNGAAYLFSSLWSPDADSQEIDSRSFMIKLVSKKHRGLDQKNAFESAEKMELAMCDSLEIWEKMMKEGCLELLAESKTTLRQIVKKPDKEKEPPYVHKWIMEELPMSSDMMRVEDISVSGNLKPLGDVEVCWSECLKVQRNKSEDCNNSDSSDQPDIEAVKWDEIDKKLAELRQADRFL